MRITKTGFILLSMLRLVFADFDMTITQVADQWSSDQIVIKNRQDQYYWNNDVFEIASFGFNSATTVSSPAGFVQRGRDTIGTYLWSFRPAGTEGGTFRNQATFFPNEEISGATPSEIGNNIFKIATDTLKPPPLFPHVVLKTAPDYGLKYPDTRSYAPSLTSADIDPVTGAVVGQADYYSPSAWRARDDASFFVDTAFQHPTQIWLGMPHMLPNTKVRDARDPADYYDATTVGQALGNSALGYYCAPHSPDGTRGLPYTHRAGSGPGGLMAVMALSWGQEFYGLDMRYIMAKSTKEVGLFLFNDSIAGMTKWNWAGSMQEGGTGPYQMNDDNYQQAIQSFPDYFPHSEAYRDWGGIGVDPALKSNIVNATVGCYLVICSRYYGYFSTARSLRLDEFQKNAADPYALIRVVSYGFNLGPREGKILSLRYGADRNTALASKNIAKYQGVVGNDAYTPRIVDLMRRLGSDSTVYDYGIAWGDVLDFVDDMRQKHYCNGIPTVATWDAMKADMQIAFDRMKGKAPTAGLTSDKISFRYNWLTMLRVMKSYMPGGLYYPKGSLMNEIEFCDNYIPTGAKEETTPQLPDTGIAPEIYWVNPGYTLPLPSRAAFQKVNTEYLNHKPFLITADVLNAPARAGSLNVRYAISSGDPTAGGYSYLLDGRHSGSVSAAPVSSDWIDMQRTGASQSPVNGSRFSAVVDVSALRNVTRRIYLEADDGCGYKTISWVDVFIKDSGIRPLELVVDKPDMTRYYDSLTVGITTLPAVVSSIRYTTDGTDPTDASPLISGTSIVLRSDSTVLKLRATAAGYDPAVGTWHYYRDLHPSSITADPVSGTSFATDTTVVLTTSPTGMTVRYTIDGADPLNSGGSVYTGPLTVSAESTVVRAVAILDGCDTAVGRFVYYRKPRASSITATPVPGSFFTVDTSVTLVTNPSGMTIRYTVDGSDPIISGSTYSSSIHLDTSATIRAVAIESGYDTAWGTFTYTKRNGVSVAAFPGDTSFYVSQSITLSSSDPAGIIWYSLDGSVPDSVSGLKYSGPISISQTITLKVIAYVNNKIAIPGSWNYTRLMDSSVVTLSTTSRVFGDTLAVSVSSNTDSLEVATSSGGLYVLYTGNPIVFDGSSPDTIILKARAHDDRHAIAESLFVFIRQYLPAVAATPAGGRYSDSAVITLSVPSHPDARIWYTMDGTDPVDTMYSLRWVPGMTLSIHSDTTIRAAAFEPGWRSAPSSTHIYDIRIPFHLTLRAVTPSGVKTPLPEVLRSLAWDGGSPTSGILISADLGADLKEEFPLYSIACRIYDPLGNIVGGYADDNGASSGGVLLCRDSRARSKLHLLWSGSNRDGRSVAAGTYIAVVSIRDADGEGTVQRIPLGVIAQ